MALHDRTNARSLLSRKGSIMSDYCCCLYSHHTEETLLHLLWHCDFTLRCWYFLVPKWVESTFMIILYCLLDYLDCYGYSYPYLLEYLNARDVNFFGRSSSYISNLGTSLQRESGSACLKSQEEAY